MVRRMVFFVMLGLALFMVGTGTLFAGGETETKGEESETATLVFWKESNEDEDPTWEKIIAEYMKANPNVKVEFVPGGGGQEAMADYDVKLTLALVSAKGPDIFSYHDVAMFKYVVNNLIVPAPDYVSEMVKKDALNEGVLEGATYGGKVYGPIYSGDWQTLYYNKDMFKEVGLNPDKPPANWDEYIEAGKKLAKTDSSGKLVRAGISLRKTGHAQGIAAKWFAFFFSAGGKEFSDDYRKALVNSDAGVQAVQLYQDILYKWKIDSIDVVADWKGFAQKTVAMFNRGPWIPAALKGAAPDMVPGVNYGTVHIPTKAISSSIGSSYPLVVTKKCRTPKAAWKFINWFMQPEVYSRFIEGSGQFPMTKSVAAMEKYAKNPIFKAFFSQPNVIAPPELPNLYELELVLGKQIESAIYQKTPAKQAMDKAAAEMNALLADVPDYLLPKK